MNKRLKAGFVAVAVFGFATTASAAELRVGHSSLPNGLGNPMCCSSNSHGWVFQSAFDHLTYMDTSGAPGPGLIASFENVGPTTWRAKIRTGVKFHNGRTMTVDDIVGQLDYLLTDEGKAKGVAMVRNLGALAGAKKIDDTTFEISTKASNPLMMNEIGILKGMDMKHFADVGFDGYATAPIGTGPYKSIKWERTRIELEAFKEGWRPGKIDKVTWLELPELAARVQALQSDQIDVALGLNNDATPQVVSSGGKMKSSVAPSVLTLMIQSTNPGPMTDVRVRQAINYGVDKDAYIDAIIGKGVTVATGQPAPRSVRGYQASIKAYPYDPQKARQLLAEAGYGNGLKLVAEVVNNTAELNDVYQYVASDLKKIGVDVELRVITLPDLIAKARGQKPIEGQLFSFDMGSFPTMDMMRSINALHSCNTQSKWTCFPEIEPTIAAANQEFNQSKRDALLAKVAQFYHDQATSIYLHEQYQLEGMDAAVQNWNPNNWVINWHEVEFQG
ncbi:MAG: ABC transporter substrate-binding protein [Alphaproteobacteria bacterium]